VALWRNFGAKVNNKLTALEAALIFGGTVLEYERASDVLRAKLEFDHLA
jgi:hypothetical protein